MKIRHNDIEPIQDDPFVNCKLGRKKHAEILTKIVNTYSEGFVLAINNKWGTGKTTFVKMWKQQLQNEGFQTLYFNSWENDFDTNPLVPLISEIKTLIKANDNESYRELLKKGAVLTKNLIPALVRAFAEKHIDSKIIIDFIDNSAKAATDILESEINQYTSKKKGLIEFRAELEKFISNNNNNKPVIFFIDELDRCRPNYSVEVLEQLKHFFSVKGIVFVLSIDKEQLGNAVKGLYGSEKLNSEEYLRRFIDLEYRIPDPSSKDICTYFYNYFHFDDFFESPNRFSFREFRYDKQDFIDFASVIFESEKFTLRQEEKLFAHTRLALNSFNHNQYTFPPLFFFLIFLRDKEPDFIKQISLRQLTLQEFTTEIEKQFFIKVLPKNTRMLLYLEALLLQFYFNFYKEFDRNLKLVSKDGSGEKDILNVNISSSINRTELIEIIVSFDREGFGNVQLDFFLNKINLLDNINF